MYPTLATNRVPAKMAIGSMALVISHVFGTATAAPIVHSSVICTVNSTTVARDDNCIVRSPSGSTADASVTDVYTLISGQATASISVSTDAFWSPPDDTAAASAFQSMILHFQTLGPVRNGIADLEMSIDGDSSGIAESSVTLRAAQYMLASLDPSCSISSGGTGCRLAGSFPIILGVPFDVVLNGGGTSSANSGGPFFSGFGSGGSITLSLFEPDRRSVQILETPEPALLPLGGLMALAGLEWFRRRRFPRRPGTKRGICCRVRVRSSRPTRRGDCERYPARLKAPGLCQ